jgi:uncharacterized protein (DUF4415 family)
MKPTKKRSPIKEKTAEELAAMPDSEIDFSDIPELDEEWFKTAELVYPRPKHSITIRLDDDVYQWFRKQGAGYQSRINAALKSYMQGNNQQ